MLECYARFSNLMCEIAHRAALTLSLTVNEYFFFFFFVEVCAPGGGTGALAELDLVP